MSTTALPTPDPAEPLLAVEDIAKTFPVPGTDPVQAVAGVSFTLGRDETLGIVGETGSGKSTLARAIIGMPRPSAGRVRFRGHDLTALRGRRLTAARAGLQMVFQDPVSALDSRWTVAESVAEPLRVRTRMSTRERRTRVAELLDLVGLDAAQHAQRYPRQLSGGQAQRVAIARALALSPELLICDEPVSALDVSVQAQIINLLQELRTRLQLSYIFVSHDLSVVRHVSDRVAVMYLGRFCEVGPAEQIFRAPAHPYTRALLDAVPGGHERETLPLAGDLPSPSRPPSGCRFRTRCPIAREICAHSEPPLRRQDRDDHRAACHFPLEPSTQALPATTDHPTADDRGAQ